MLQGSPEGDSITVYPSKVDPHCEALIFIVSASDTDVTTMNLDTPDTLQFSGFSAGVACSFVELLEAAVVNEHRLV